MTHRRQRCAEAGCLTLLSVSNPGERCRLHTPDLVWSEAKQRAGRRGMAFDKPVGELTPSDVAAFWSGEWL